MIGCVVIDTETSSLGDDAEVIELGVALYSNRHISGVVSALCKPPAGTRIDPRATAVHGIRAADLATANTFDWVWQTMAAQHFVPIPGDEDGIYAVAHNAAFERRFIGPNLTLNARWICTWKVALALIPDAPAYGLRELFHWLTIDDAGNDLYELGGQVIDFTRVWPAHRAANDAYVNALLLAHLLELAPASDMAAITEGPARLRLVGFGKHQGARWEDLPTDYMLWMLRQDFDEDTVFTVKAVLKERGQKFD